MSLARLFVAVAHVLAGILLGVAPVSVEAQYSGDERGVPYVTVRNRTGSSVPALFYGDERSDLKSGWCGIDQRPLEFLVPMAEAAPFYIPEEILRVGEVREMPREDLFKGLRVAAAGDAPLLYVHGFYIDFEKGCRRATIFQENAGLQGRLLWFSWPSDGAILNYTRDEADLYWSVPELAETIADLAEAFGEARVDVAGHSLGSRGLVLALYELASRHPDLRLGEIVLLAPDVDFDLFRKMLPRIRPLVEGITIYVADADRPLGLSAQVHGYPRLGQTGNDVMLLGDVEVIDLSALPVRSPTGHLYHIYNMEVGMDLGQLLNERKRAAVRSGLVQTGTNLWSRQPGE